MFRPLMDAPHSETAPPFATQAIAMQRLALLHVLGQCDVAQIKIKFLMPARR